MTGEVLNKKVESAKIVYFSGTGGTTRIVNCIEKALRDNDVRVFVEPLDFQISYEKRPNQLVDLLIIVYAVHAFDAPEPVYEWLRESATGRDLPTAIISVSGGGEVWPNTASRFSLIKELERKQFSVFYERMFVMPSNWIVETREDIALHLLKVLPVKAESTVAEILSGKISRSKPKISARVISFLFKIEKPAARFYAKDLKAGKNCNGCGWCAKSCPRKNIKISIKKPAFGWKCVLCLRCVYGCPQKALKSRIFRFIAVRGGYDLRKLEKLIDEKGLKQLVEIENSETGSLYKGVISYLSDDKK